MKAIIKYILNIAITGAILMGVYSVGEYSFYKLVPLDFIASTNSIIAEDVKQGDLRQTVVFDRDVKITHKALIVRELNLVSVDYRSVVYKKSVTIIDKEESGLVTVVYDLPEGLEKGQYYWAIGIERYFPYNIIRNSTLQSEVFNIE